MDKPLGVINMAIDGGGIKMGKNELCSIHAVAVDDDHKVFDKLEEMLNG